MTAETTYFPWNIVLKDAELTAAAQQQLRRKLSPLARLLQGFLPDAVHLQTVVERLLRPPRFRVALTLRVPSHIVHGEKTTPDLFSAVTRALAVLQREVQSLKARLAQTPLRDWSRTPDERLTPWVMRQSSISMSSGFVISRAEQRGQQSTYSAH